MVLCSRMSHDGRKQSSYIGYTNVNHLEIAIGFMASHVDGGLFVLHDKDQGIVIAAVMLYEDDLLIIADEGLIGQIKNQTKKRVRMHDLGSVSLYLAMHIEWNREHHTNNIHQHSLGKFRMHESRPVTTPMATKLDKRMPDEEACDRTLYQTLIGYFRYAMTTARTAITYAIGLFNQFNYDLRNEHMITSTPVFRYLNGTKDWRLHFGGALTGVLGGALGGDGEGALGYYVDLDYGGCPDDYKLTSRLVITFGWVVDCR